MLKRCLTLQAPESAPDYPGWQYAHQHTSHPHRTIGAPTPQHTLCTGMSPLPPTAGKAKPAQHPETAAGTAVTAACRAAAQNPDNPRLYGAPGGHRCRPAGALLSGALMRCLQLLVTVIVVNVHVSTGRAVLSVYDVSGGVSCTVSDQRSRV